MHCTRHRHGDCNPVRAKRSIFSNVLSQAMDDRVRPENSRSMSDSTTLAMREVLEGRRTGWSVLLPFAGPAVVVSVAYMDPGNFATNIQAGARYGYSLLWVVLLANLIAMLFQVLSAKLGIVTGKNLAELCRGN